MKKRWLTLLGRLDMLRGIYVMFSAPQEETDEIYKMIVRANLIPKIIEGDKNIEKGSLELKEINAFVEDRMSYITRGTVKTYQQNLEQQEAGREQQRKELSEKQQDFVNRVSEYITKNNIKLDNYESLS
jgi:hypothetical protein